MANRTVSVELKLQAEQYKAEAEAAKLKTEELDRKVEALDHDLNKIPADATKAGVALDAMGAGATKAGTGVDDLNKKTSQARDEFGRFKKSTEEGGAAAEGLGKKAEGLGADAEGLGKKLGGLTGDIEKVGSEAEKSGMSLGDLGTPAMVGGIAALVVPALALAGALTSVAAAGGIAGAGIAGAIAGNPEAFKAEWGTAIGEVKKDWIAASEPFVGPTLAAIRSVGPLIDSWHLDTMFQKASTYVEPLVHAVEGFATGVETGVAALVDKAGPEIAVLAAELPQIGQSIGTALTLISDNSEGGAQALHDFDVALEKIVITTGALISGSEAVAGALTSANAAVKHFLDDIPTWVYIADPLLLLPRKIMDVFTPEPFDKSATAAGRLGTSLAGVTGAVGDFGAVGGGALYTIDHQIADTIAMVDRMNKAFDEATRTVLNQRDADVAVAQGLADLAKGWKAGADALDINTQKGRDNVTLIDRTIGELEKKRQADIAAGGGTKDAYDKANAAYQQAIRGLENTIEKLGVGKAEADKFFGAFKDKTVTVTVKINQVGSVSQQGVISGGVPRFGGYAEGGDPPPGMAWAGERGPELVDFRGGEHVYTSSQSRAMMAASSPSWGGSSGSTAVQVSLAAAPGAGSTALGTFINGLIRDGYIVVKASQVRQG